MYMRNVKYVPYVVIFLESVNITDCNHTGNNHTQQPPNTEITVWSHCWNNQTCGCVWLHWCNQ